LRTTTLDPLSTDAILVRIVRTSDGWMATLAHGLRHGIGKTPESAVADLMDSLRELASIEGLIAPKLAEEVKWARGICA
jgi:hypothetical protein